MNSIQLPIEVWYLADRYYKAVQEISKASNPSVAVDSAFDLKQELRSLIDPHLTSAVTIEISDNALLTFYRNHQNPSAIHVLTSQQIFRPKLDRASSEAQ
jgi:hypothetical protein